MNKFTVAVVNAFVDGDHGGNPAGVVLDAERFSDETKQAIAAKVGLSETAFVSPSSTADFKLEFFTPTRQIAHCGHATIATFSYLVQQGRVSSSRSSKETIDGNRDIFIVGEMAFMEQSAPTYKRLNYGSSVTFEAVLSSLNLTGSDVLEGHEPMIVNTGVNCLIVPLKNESAVAMIKPNFQAVSSVSETLDLIEYYVFSTETRVSWRDAGARMFAPLYGIEEEAATGMAAGPLACYLYDYLNLKKNKIIIEQGHLMHPPSPSELIAELAISNGRIEKLTVGGLAKVSGIIEIEI